MHEPTLPDTLDPDDRDLIRHLFAKATALLEDAHGIAAQGQSSRLSPEEITDCVIGILQAQDAVEHIALTLGHIVG